MKDIKEVSATTYLEVMAHCPHCDSYQDVGSRAHEVFDYNELSTDECDFIVNCDRCKEEFRVTEITY